MEQPPGHLLHLTPVEHAGVGEGWTDEGCVDAVVASEDDLVVEDLSEADHAELGRAVVGQLVGADQPHGAGHVDDVPMVHPQHRRQKALHRL